MVLILPTYPEYLRLSDGKCNIIASILFVWANLDSKSALNLFHKIIWCVQCVI